MGLSRSLDSFHVVLSPQTVLREIYLMRISKRVKFGYFYKEMSFIFLYLSLIAFWL